MKIKDAVVKQMAKCCQAKGIRKNELANLAGLTPSTVYSFFDGTRRDVGIVTLKKLCDGLDISIADFFNDPLFQNLEQEME